MKLGSLGSMTIPDARKAAQQITGRLLHDLGLLQQFATPHTSFEVDGANRSESLVRESGAPARRSEQGVEGHRHARHALCDSTTRVAGGDTRGGRCRRGRGRS